MSDKYSKNDIKYIAEDLVEELRECKDGTVTTTAMLAKKYGYDGMEMEDLFDLHDALFRTAKAHKITLDMSEHDGKVEGLPFNLTFIVRNKKAQIKCPHCGSTDTARYLYGYPAFNEEMQKKLDEGKMVLGGCCIDVVHVNDQRVTIMPTRRCNKCKKDFGKPPILKTRNEITAEDYRDIVESIKFSVGGFHEGHTDITITKNENGAFVNVEQFLIGDLDIPENRQITPARWQKIVNTLYNQLYLHEWKKKYVDPLVLDGTQWSLDIKLTNGRKREYYGSNLYPPYWPELKKIFRPFAKIR